MVHEFQGRRRIRLSECGLIFLMILVKLAEASFTLVIHQVTFG